MTMTVFFTGGGNDGDSDKQLLLGIAVGTVTTLVAASLALITTWKPIRWSEWLGETLLWIFGVWVVLVVIADAAADRPLGPSNARPLHPGSRLFLVGLGLFALTVPPALAGWIPEWLAMPLFKLLGACAVVGAIWSAIAKPARSSSTTESGSGREP
jgi:putative Mn2+ efflux pump MntP